MKQVTVIYDTSTHTWNAMHNGLCVFYGSADDLDKWLDNSNEYEED
jgi:hypothetical protein